MRRGGALLAVVVALLAAAPPAAGGWGARRDAAVRFVEGRQGSVSFAFVDYRGRLHGYRRWRVAPSASLLKAMLLVAYVNRSDVRRRDLTDDERALLRPMIRRSDNEAATVILGRVGERRLDRLALRAGMRHFRLRSPWGLSEVTAGDQARFFFRIDSHIVKRHRRFAMRQLRSVVRPQRWGIPPVAPSGWDIAFKGGWGSGTGRVTHQSALLVGGPARLAVSVLTGWNPSHVYGTRTIRGVARRLLRTPLPAPG